MFKFLHYFNFKKFLVVAVGIIILLNVTMFIIMAATSPKRSITIETDENKKTSTQVVWHCSTPLQVYGHYLLDTVYPIARFLKYKYHDIGHDPLHFTFVTDYYPRNGPSANLHRILWNVVGPDDYIEEDTIIRNRSVIINKNSVPLSNFLFKNERNEEINLAPGFYSADLHSYYIRMWMQNFAKSIKPNNVFLRNENWQFDGESSGLREFRELAIKKCQLSDVKMEDNLVTLSGRYTSGQREFRLGNIPEYRSKFEAHGLVLEIFDPYKFSFCEQVKQMLRTKYHLGPYGSNMANSIFLDSKAVVIYEWPNVYCKIGFIHRYDIITHAILARGIRLVNVDRFPSVDDFSIYGITDDKFFEYSNDGFIVPKEEFRNYLSLSNYNHYPMLNDAFNFDFTSNATNILTAISMLQSNTSKLLVIPTMPSNFSIFG